jgi:hypothetical protein
MSIILIVMVLVLVLGGGGFHGSRAGLRDGELLGLVLLILVVFLTGNLGSAPVVR